MGPPRLLSLTYNVSNLDDHHNNALDDIDSDMKISCNMISKSCLFSICPTKVFIKIKLKFTNSIFAQIILK